MPAMRLQIVREYNSAAVDGPQHLMDAQSSAARFVRSLRQFCLAIVPHSTMDAIPNVKAGLSLHKDCEMVTLTDTVMDRYNFSWQIGKDEV
eukprot:g20615.t1